LIAFTAAPAGQKGTKFRSQPELLSYYIYDTRKSGLHVSTVRDRNNSDSKFNSPTKHLKNGF